MEGRLPPLQCGRCWLSICCSPSCGTRLGANFGLGISPGRRAFPFLPKLQEASSCPTKFGSWGLCEGGSPSQGGSPFQAPYFLPQFPKRAESTGKEACEGASWPEPRVPDLALSWEAGPIQGCGRPRLCSLASQPSTSPGLAPDPWHLTSSRGSHHVSTACIFLLLQL